MYVISMLNYPAAQNPFQIRRLRGKVGSAKALAINSIFLFEHAQMVAKILFWAQALTHFLQFSRRHFKVFL